MTQRPPGQHTRGPYVLSTYEFHFAVGDFRDGEEGYYVKAARGRLIARFPFSKRGEEFERDISGEQRANAKLFASSPSLLAAAKHVGRLLVGRSDLGADLQRSVRALERAIAEAEGLR